MQISAKDINQFTVAKANVIFAESVLTKIAQTVLVQKSVLVINQHTAVKANVIFVESV